MKPHDWKKVSRWYRTRGTLLGATNAIDDALQGFPEVVAYFIDEHPGPVWSAHLEVSVLRTLLAFFALRLPGDAKDAVLQAMERQTPMGVGFTVVRHWRLM
jgi:hypothetical protein